MIDPKNATLNHYLIRRILNEIDFDNGGKPYPSNLETAILNKCHPVFFLVHLLDTSFSGEYESFKFIFSFGCNLLAKHLNQENRDLLVTALRFLNGDITANDLLNANQAVNAINTKITRFFKNFVQNMNAYATQSQRVFLDNVLYDMAYLIYSVHLSEMISSSPSASHLLEMWSRDAAELINNQ